MSVFVHGWGAVSPAGWGARPLVSALTSRVSLPVELQAHPGSSKELPVRKVPKRATRPPELVHPRLRRTSAIGQYAAAAALEALGGARGDIGVVYCTLSGCVNYSRRFYAEVLCDPSTASPLLFPETVTNSPASHVSAMLGSTALNYTLVGDQTCLLQGLAMAAEWLEEERLPGCVVIGAEELDWLIAGGSAVFRGRAPVTEGAGAVYISREESPIRLEAITETLPGEREVIGALGGTAQDLRLDPAAVTQVVGEGYLASTAWNLVRGLSMLRDDVAAGVSIVVAGTCRRTGGVRFAKQRLQAPAQGIPG